MAIPLIPFAAGIAVGALAAYGYKDATVREMAGKGAQWLSDSAAGIYESVAGALSGAFGSGVVSAEGPAARIVADQESAAADQPTDPAT